MTALVVASVQDVPICRGCGLMSQLSHGDLCSECFARRERAIGGGPRRVVTGNDTYHETARCPAVQTASTWAYLSDEDCMYADLADLMNKCPRCHRHTDFGFDHFVGDSAPEAAIGHC